MLGKPRLLFFLLLMPFLPATGVPVVPASDRVKPPESRQVAQVKANLMPVETVVVPASNREFWTRAGGIPYIAEYVDRAAEALERTLPTAAEWRSAYLLFTETGDRSTWESLVRPVKDSIRLLAVAESVENEGRFLPPLEARIRDICSWPTWVGNAHDAELANLEGIKVQIDLMAAMMAADLSCALMLLEESMDPATVALLRKHLRERVLEPFRKEVTGDSNPAFWLSTTNNWNAVCLAGVAVTALAAAGDPGDLAWHLAAADQLVGNFLDGFSSDGYCSEGLSYWTYGYGHFIILTEYLRRATRGLLDPFRRESARKAATFPFTFYILDDVYPAFADCPVDVAFPMTWGWYVARRLGVREPAVFLEGHLSAQGYNLYGRLIFLDPLLIPVPQKSEPVTFDPYRHFYEDAGVLISRSPGPSSFGVAIKAGHNDEHHNHNDVGSFVVVHRGRPVLCDPGKEHYTRDTFVAETRYASPVHNSYGHPVPVVAGKLQETGPEARGKILSHSFTGMKDSVVIDLAGAYEVPELELLERTLEVDRQQQRLVIRDHVRFSEPQSFSTALVSYGSFQFSGNGFTVQDGPSRVQVQVEMEGARPVYSEAPLEADWQTAGRGEVDPRRFEIACDQPVTEAVITCILTFPDNP